MSFPPDPLEINREYEVGDTIVGFFACTDRQHREEAVVSARFDDGGRPAFVGRNAHPPRGMGWGVWGYDDEIEAVVRRADA